MDETLSLPTIGVLYAGDLGGRVAKLFVDAGFPVVTTCEDRSETTRKNAVASGARILDTVEDVVCESDVLLSMVLPEAAVELAERCATAMSSMQSASRKCYVDVNSIHPETTKQIAQIATNEGMDFADATIHGTASQLATRGVLYVSGPSAALIARAFEKIVRVSQLGDDVGTASTMKLLMAGMSKGLAALFVEMSTVARRNELLDEFLDEYETFYPAIDSVLKRLVATYPRHAARRVTELRAISSISGDFEAGMIRAACMRVEELAQMNWPDNEKPPSAHDVLHFST